MNNVRPIGNPTPNSPVKNAAGTAPKSDKSQGSKPSPKKSPAKKGGKGKK